MSRKFSGSQKVSLFISGDGHCAICGKELEKGWHADHIRPHHVGGETKIENGQPLCPVCNLKKGAKMGREDIVLRQFQKRFVESGLEKLRNNEKTLVANIHPGSGKTLAAQHFLNELYKRGEIDAAAIFVPRINLCQQFELDWKEIKKRYPSPKMGDLEHRPNLPPLLRGNDQFGYITTYDSLTSDLRPHLYEFKKYRNRIALILDEASRLGMSERIDMIGTQSAEAVEELSKLARFTVVMTGTFGRADGLPILPKIVSYSDPDENGFRYLQADVEATYTEGVREHYLRRFEFITFDGKATREFLDRTNIDQLSDLNEGFSAILMHSDYWHPLVDETVKKVREQQQTYKPFAGLIGAARQDHARKIKEYLDVHHPDIRSLIAISDDGKKAHEALSQFKEHNHGKYDILITVGMAYIGYDYKPITVVCCLNAFRFEGWLRQFFARGMRAIPDVDYNAQTLIGIVPDDKRMQEFCEKLRTESQSGIREREAMELEINKQQPEISIVQGVNDIEIGAIGHDSGTDLPPQEYAALEKIRLAHVPQVPITALKACINELNNLKPETRVKKEIPVNRRPTMTAIEWEKKFRNKLNDLCKEIARLKGAPSLVNWNTGHELRLRIFGKSVEQCSLEELEEQIEWAENLIIQINSAFTKEYYDAGN